MISPELRERIAKVLREQDGYTQFYDFETEDEYENGYCEFSGAARVNWISFLITILYLKLEKDGEVPAFSSDLSVEDTDYSFVPFKGGDTDVSAMPIGALQKKCLEDAGFRFPTRFNYLPNEETDTTEWGTAMQLYVPDADTEYSVHTDLVDDIDLEILLAAMDSLEGAFIEEFSPEVQQAIEYAKTLLKKETGRECKYLVTYEELSDEEFEAADLSEEKVRNILYEQINLPWGTFCMYHEKWQKVRAIYFQETTRANAAGEEPKYPFDKDAYSELDREVARIIRLSVPNGSTGMYFDVVDIDASIDGAPVLVQFLPDVNTYLDEGYGHAVLLVNPLFYVTPEFPLIYKEVNEKIDKFYASVFPGEAGK